MEMLHRPCELATTYIRYMAWSRTVYRQRWLLVHVPKVLTGILYYLRPRVSVFMSSVRSR